MKVLMKKFKLRSKEAQSVRLDVSNTDRAFGTIFGSEITPSSATRCRTTRSTVDCHGDGGQSFGAFIPKGLTLELVGDATTTSARVCPAASSSSPAEGHRL